MTIRAQVLGADNASALDELLAEAGLAGAFARNQLAMRAPGAPGMLAFGWPQGAKLGAAIVTGEGICWTVWRDQELCPAIARQLTERTGDLLSGERSYVEPLLNLLPQHLIGMQDRCPFEALTLATFIPPTNTPNPAPRQATLDDMEALIDFYIRGFYSLAHLPTREAWRRRLTQQLDYRTIFICEQNGVIRAAAQSSAETPDKAILGGVATLREYRSQGYSTAVVAALCAYLFSRQVNEIGLFYMPGNNAAARVYAKLGFKQQSEWWLTRISML